MLRRMNTALNLVRDVAKEEGMAGNLSAKCRVIHSSQPVNQLAGGSEKSAFLQKIPILLHCDPDQLRSGSYAGLCE